MPNFKYLSLYFCAWLDWNPGTQHLARSRLQEAQITINPFLLGRTLCPSCSCTACCAWLNLSCWTTSGCEDTWLNIRKLTPAFLHGHKVRWHSYTGSSVFCSPSTCLCIFSLEGRCEAGSAGAAVGCSPGAALATLEEARLPISPLFKLCYPCSI